MNINKSEWSFTKRREMMQKYTLEVRHELTGCLAIVSMGVVYSGFISSDRIDPKWPIESYHPEIDLIPSLINPFPLSLDPFVSDQLSHPLCICRKRLYCPCDYFFLILKCFEYLICRGFSYFFKKSFCGIQFG